MLTNYIKIAWKVLLRHPFYTFITLFGISLTLTVLMVLTSFLDHLVGAHYPEMKRDRSLYLERVTLYDSAKTSSSSSTMSFKFLTNYAKSLKTPERVAIGSTANKSSVYVGSRKVDLHTKFTDADFWIVNDFTFLEGKPYNEQSITTGDYVAVITDSFKKQYFANADAPVIGKTVDIGDIRYKVIGVVKGVPVTRQFSYADVYLPYTAPKSNYQASGTQGNYMAVILAKDQRDVKQIQEEFQGRVAQIPLPAVEKGFKYGIIEVISEPFGQFFISTFTNGNPGIKAAFYGTIAFILLMLLGLPAINLVNLNVGRIMERASEIGVRKAFGAPIRALLWQFIIENIFITFIGGTIALVLTSVIIYLINSSGWIAYADLTINTSVFLVSVLVALIFGLLSGVLPAFRMSKLPVTDALKS